MQMRRLLYLWLYSYYYNYSQQKRMWSHVNARKRIYVCIYYIIMYNVVRSMVCRKMFDVKATTMNLFADFIVRMVRAM